MLPIVSKRNACLPHYLNRAATEGQFTCNATNLLVLGADAGDDAMNVRDLGLKLLWFLLSFLPFNSQPNRKTLDVRTLNSPQSLWASFAVYLPAAI